MIHVVSENAIDSKTGWFGEIGNNVFTHFLEIESTYDSEKIINLWQMDKHNFSQIFVRIKIIIYECRHTSVVPFPVVFNQTVL